MNKKYFLYTLNIFLFVNVLILPSGFLSAQQDLFNVPAMKITEKGKNFIQEQIIFYPVQTQFDTTYVHGLGNNQEIGISAFNYFLTSPYTNSPATNISASLGPYPTAAPNFQFVYQKKFEPTEIFHVSVGTKTGIASGATPASSSFATYNFLVTSTKIESLRTTLFIGAYSGNAAFFGYYKHRLLPGSESSISLVGMMYGIEVDIVPEKFRLVCDMIAGVNSVGVSVCGFSYDFSKSFFISVGYQIPNPKDGTFNPHALLIELNAYF
ncbi:hypothetical protein LEP1GSC058_4037 [Leptospira fainei serovar Hurstbridge str. BUT 6]|uniref:MetA-pathway of phenol degradation n=1 Tax=Leptospira fainei serovar Hurstbridge str. BUT 6 TaxID=1193011 RepID=S3UUG5_9LEPT|nr:hypothetical protein [Leptospira fainei]EPG74041.1 hypothetical protein LEP1GSC058_4037 [Leptospira fainei serovar Hurstbridge str. BUT 6]